MACLAQLGGNGFFSCRVANDDFGNKYDESLKNLGLASNINNNRPDGVTGNCRVLLTEDAEKNDVNISWCDIRVFNK